MNADLNPQMLTASILVAAGMIYLIRLGFTLFQRNKRALGLAVGIPPAIYALGLIMAWLGYGTF